MHALAASRPSSNSDRSFFAHHGFWAPGIRLFRRLGFALKASIVSLCFVLPLAVLAWAWFSQYSEQRDFTAKEIDGVTFTRVVMPLLPAVMQQRQDALKGEGTAGREAVAEALKQVDAAQAASGDAFGTAPALKLLKERLAGLPAAGAGSEQLLSGHGAAAQAVIDLVGQATDGSNLTLDPDIDTYYLMDGALMRIPQLTEEVGRLRVLAAAVAGGGAGDATQVAQMHRAQAYAELLRGQLAVAVAKVETVHPGTAKALHFDKVEETEQRFFKLASDMSDAPAIADAGTALAGLLQAQQAAMLDQLNDLLTARQARLDSKATLIAVVVLLGMLLAAYFFLSFYRVMAGGLNETRRHLRAMTDGDLTTHPHPWGHDEAAELMVSLAQMQASLRAIVADVRDGSEDILHASSEIATGAMDLSSRTEQTAANLEQTAASMEQISGTVASTADHAAQAATLARENADAANDGGQAMAAVFSRMESIGQSSSRIGEIIGVIDGIAFQTNILALNAAVEAARAGDAGRGFAVVASEVRALAQRSGSAAREIKTLIQTSVQQVHSGNAVVADARRAIERTVDNAGRVGALMEQIAVGAREQSTGVQQVGQAAQELDRTTQSNAALVEETAAAAAALRDRAAALAGKVAAFRLPAGSLNAPAAAPSQASAVFDFDQAIEAHRAWKVKLRGAIANQQKLDAETLCRDDRCPLGQWLHGAGSKRWGSHPAFVQLIGQHAEFHQEAGAVAKAVNQGAYEQAERLIGSGSRFAEVSTATVTDILRAKRDLR